MNEFKPRGVCSTKVSFEIKDERVYSISFEDGCEGNLKALSRLLEGMRTTELIDKLKGIECEERPTSCADQLAQAVAAAIGARN